MQLFNSTTPFSCVEDNQEFIFYAGYSVCEDMIACDLCLLDNLMMMCHDISWTDVLHDKLMCRSMVYFYMICHNVTSISQSYYCTSEHTVCWHYKSHLKKQLGSMSFLFQVFLYDLMSVHIVNIFQRFCSWLCIIFNYYNNCSLSICHKHIKLTLHQGYCSKSISRMPPEEGNVVLGWFQTSGSLRKINHGLF